MMSMEVTGIGNTLLKLSALEVACKVGVGLAQRAAGETVQERAKALVPVATGALQASIATTEDARGVLVGTPLYYAIMVEFGTEKMAAQPFLRPAVASEEVQQAIVLGLSAAIRSVVGL